MGKKQDKALKSSIMNTVHWIDGEIKKYGKSKAVEHMMDEDITVKTCAPNPDKFQILYQNRVHTFGGKKIPTYATFKTKCKCLFSFKRWYGSGNAEVYVFDVSAFYSTIKTVVMYKLSTSRNDDEYKFMSSKASVGKSYK